VLALFGGYTLFQNFTGGSLTNLPFIGGNPACEGGNEWTVAADRRYRDVISRNAQLSPYSSSPAEVQAHADLLKRYSVEQSNSSPPEAGKELNEQWVTFYLFLGQNFDAVANDDRAPHSEQELRRMSDEILRLQSEYNSKCAG